MSCTMDKLYDACVYSDLSRLSPGARMDYGFVNCDSMEEEHQLLEMYQDLLFHHLRFKHLTRDALLQQLHETCIQGRLLELVENTYSQQDPTSIYLSRIHSKPHLLKNPYPLPSQVCHDTIK